MSPRLLPARECGGNVDAAEISATRAFGVSRNLASRASARLRPTPASTRPASRTYLLVIADPSGPKSPAWLLARETISKPAHTSSLMIGGSVRIHVPPLSYA